MKKIQFLLALVCLWVLPADAQQLQKCDSTKSYWTFSEDSVYLSVKITGNARETNRKGLISVDKYVLQNVLVDKAKFVEKGKDSNGLEVLIGYALEEAGYISGQFGKQVNIQLEMAPLSDGRKVLVWFFEMPEGMNKEVKFQLFANLIVGDKIFGLGSSQFADQDFKSVKDFLIDVISTAKTADGASDFDKLCED